MTRLFAIANDDFRRVRRRNYCWSIVALIVLPTLAAMAGGFAQSLYWQLWGWWSVFFYVLWALAGIVGGVFTTQLIVWWQWPLRNQKRFRAATGLLLAYLTGICVGYLWTNRHGSIDTLPAVFISFGHTLSSIATHWLALLVVGSVKAYQLADVTSQPSQADVQEMDSGRAPHEESPAPECGSQLSQDSNLGQSELGQSELGQSELGKSELGPPNPRRQPLSISLMMFATLAFALTFTLLRITREIYSDSNFGEEYPASDFGSVAWLLSSAGGNVCCLMAAVNWYCRRSLIVSLLIMLCAMLISLGGNFAWALFNADSNVMSQAALKIVIVDSCGMFLIHLWMFKRWARAGFRLE